MVSSVVANMIAAVALVILGWALSIMVRLPFVYRHRRELFRFFGITKDKQRLMVYLSTVFVQPFGSADFRGASRSFSGPAIPAIELAAVQPVLQLFLSPVLDGLPSRMREWLGDRGHWTFRLVLPTFSASPAETSQVQPENMLAVGSQYYNAAADLYAETENPFLKMEQVGAQMRIRVLKGPRSGDTFEARPESGDDMAIVERLLDDAHNTTIFIAAGLGVVGTRGAVQYLVDNWARLHKDFGVEPFAVCLRFQDVAADPNAYRKPVELSRFH